MVCSSTKKQDELQPVPAPKVLKYFTLNIRYPQEMFRYELVLAGAASVEHPVSSACAFL